MKTNEITPQSAVLLKVAEVAIRLSVSKQMVYKLIGQGLLPCVHLGKARRVRPEDLEMFVEENISTRNQARM